VSHKEKKEADGAGDPDFVDRCNGTVHRMIKKGGNKYLCAVDGSDAAHLAFQFMMSLVRPIDSVLIFHAYRAKRTGKMEYEPDVVLKKYTQHMTASMHPTSQYEFVWQERKSDEGLIHTLQEHLGTYEYSWEAFRPKAPPDFVILGQHGRLQVPMNTPTSLGTIASLALRTVHVPCIIAKKYITSGPRQFVFFVNGSLSSKLGFEILVQMVRSRDTLTLVHVANKLEEEETKEDDAHVAEMREYFEEELDKYGPRKCSFVATHIKPGQAIKERMVEYVNTAEPDLMVMAPRAKDFLSSTTEYVVSHVYCSLILCKN
jgi:nucleotide-binding universal stress UspA family protein